MVRRKIRQSIAMLLQPYKTIKPNVKVQHQEMTSGLKYFGNTGGVRSANNAKEMIGSTTWKKNASR
jgi:hypothetical protein